MRALVFAFVITLLTGAGSSHAQHEVNIDHATERVSGVPVIQALSVEELAVGRHHFFFKAGAHSNAQPLYVPVIVLKGAHAGKRLALTAAVHGDELNGIAVIHQLLEGLESSTLTGTILALPGVNQTGMVGNSRYFLSSGGGGAQIDPNRIFPGTLTGGNVGERFIGAVWHALLKNNADIAVDIHTQTTGSRYPLFVFADFRNSVAHRMAFSLMPDLIKNDGGQKGTLETTYVKASIPAVTLEVGGPKVFQPDLVERAVRGIRNLMVVEGMLEGSRERPDAAPFVGSSYTNVQAEEAGTAHIQVELLDKVEKGQLVAIIVDPFGQEVRRYFAPHEGRVLAIATDPLREAGAMLVRILR